MFRPNKLERFALKEAAVYVRANPGCSHDALLTELRSYELSHRQALLTVKRLMQEPAVIAELNGCYYPTGR